VARGNPLHHNENPVMAPVLTLSTAATMTTLEARKDDGRPHDDLGPALNVVVWFLTVLALVFFSLRIYCKFLRKRALWWDDYVLIAAMIMLLAQTISLSVHVHFGFGKHSWDIVDWYNWLYVANITGVLSITAAAWSKTSFAITLLRFSDGRTRWLVWFLIFTINLTLGLSAIFTYAQCSPVQKLWDSNVKGSCWPQHIIINYNSFSSGQCQPFHMKFSVGLPFTAYSGVADIALALLPWRIIHQRSLKKKERFGVLLAMSMGVL
jgi:hypothetical protein